jgi:hypothetical protein
MTPAALLDALRGRGVALARLEFDGEVEAVRPRETEP